MSKILASDEELIAVIKDVISEIVRIGRDDIGLDSNLKQLFKIDSLQEVEIFSALENKLNISIADNKMPKVDTVNDILNELKNHING